MAESPTRVDLRLTIPVTAPYPEIAVDLAAKFAEYAGASKTATVHVSQEVATAVGTAADGRASVDLLLSATGGEVTVTVTSSD